MDITERKITKIAREAEKLVLRTLREKDAGGERKASDIAFYLPKTGGRIPRRA